MSTLTKLQKAVQKNILAGDLAARNHVVGTRQVSVGARLNIYREAYYLRLAEALATTYSSLHTLLGEEQFQQLARLYTDAHPSHHYSVRYFGHRLASFLAKEDPYRSTPVLTALARWEWAVAEVFDAYDPNPITADALQRVPPEGWAELRFRFHTAICLVSSHWNVSDIWSALNHEQPPPEPARSTRKRRWAIWRRGLEVFFSEMRAREEEALRAALRGERFADICEHTPASLNDTGAASWAAGLLTQWVERGWIVHLRGMRAA